MIHHTLMVTHNNLFSSILDNNITIQQGELKIIKGNLLEGVIDKRMNKTIISKIWNKLGPDASSDYLYNIQRMTIQYLYNRGFSVGLGDCVLPKQAMDEVELFLEKRRNYYINVVKPKKEKKLVEAHDALPTTLVI